MNDPKPIIARAFCRSQWNINIDDPLEAGRVMPRIARNAADAAIADLYAAGILLVPRMLLSNHVLLLRARALNPRASAQERAEAKKLADHIRRDYRGETE